MATRADDEQSLPAASRVWFLGALGAVTAILLETFGVLTWQVADEANTLATAANELASDANQLEKNTDEFTQQMGGMVRFWRGTLRPTPSSGTKAHLDTKAQSMSGLTPASGGVVLLVSDLKLWRIRSVNDGGCPIVRRCRPGTNQLTVTSGMLDHGENGITKENECPQTPEEVYEQLQALLVRLQYGRFCQVEIEKISNTLFWI